ncbi:MAG TPA: oligosaccharide flippase family protein [Aestuariivirga sp.]|nr:oligosaccharide flippase family protein [Aestuariivirga sp.]
MSPIAMARHWRARMDGDRIASLILRGGFTSLSVRVAGLVLGFISHVMLSRMLGASNYGLYAIAMGWCMILVVPAKFGLDHTALRYASIYFDEGQPGAVRALMAFSAKILLAAIAIIGVGLSALLWTGAEALGLASFHQAPWFILLLGSLAFLGVFSAFFRAAHRIFLSQFFEQVLRSLLLIALLAFAYVTGPGTSLSDALAVTALSAFGAFAAMMMWIRRLLPVGQAATAKTQDHRAWFGLSWPMLSMALIQQVMAQIGVILLGAFSTSQDAGHYAAAARLAAFVPFALVALNAITAPMIAAAHKREDRSEMHRIARVSARSAFAFAAIVSLILGLGGETLLRVFGSDFESAYPALLVLLAGGLTNAATGSVGFFMTMTGQQLAAMVCAVCALIVNAALGLWLIPAHGAIGAAIATAAGVAALNMLQHYLVRSRLGVDTSVLGLPVKTVEA